MLSCNLILHNARSCGLEKMDITVTRVKNDRQDSTENRYCSFIHLLRSLEKDCPSRLLKFWHSFGLTMITSTASLVEATHSSTFAKH